MIDIDTNAARREERNRAYGIVRLLSAWSGADHRRLSIVAYAILNGESVDAARQQLEREGLFGGQSVADDRDRAPQQQSGGRDRYGWNRVIAKLNKPDAEHTEDAA